jgi:hypothetical protein
MLALFAADRAARLPFLFPNTPNTCMARSICDVTQ